MDDVASNEFTDPVVLQLTGTPTSKLTSNTSASSPNVIPIANEVIPDHVADAVDVQDTGTPAPKFGTKRSGTLLEATSVPAIASPQASATKEGSSGKVSKPRVIKTE